MPDLEQFITKREVKEHIEVVCPVEKHFRVLKALFEADYRVTRSGSYMDEKLWPRCDNSRSLFFAERKYRGKEEANP